MNGKSLVMWWMVDGLRCLSEVFEFENCKPL